MTAIRIPTQFLDPLGTITRALLLAMTLSARGVQGEVESPFSASNLSPLAQIHGLPWIRSAQVTEGGEFQVEVVQGAASNFTAETKGDESIWFDGESYRSTIAIVRGFSENFELGLAISCLAISAGEFDSVIDAYHGAIGIQIDRSAFPPRTLRYSYDDSEGEVFNMVDAATRLGDLRVSWGWQLKRATPDSGVVVALRAELKLPTGSSPRLLGSGSFDQAVWTSVSQSSPGMGGLQWYGGLGVIHTGNERFLRDRRRRLAEFGSVGFTRKLTPRSSAKIQIDTNSAFYGGSSLRQVSGIAAQLMVGGTMRVRTGIDFDFAITEDLIATTAPDIGVHLGWRITSVR